jgi:hypothetical protein
LWQQVRGEVYHIRPGNVEELEERITYVLTSIPENMLPSPTIKEMCL